MQQFLPFLFAALGLIIAAVVVNFAVDEPRLKKACHIVLGITAIIIVVWFCYKLLAYAGVL